MEDCRMKAKVNGNSKIEVVEVYAVNIRCSSI